MKDIILALLITILVWLLGSCELMDYTTIKDDYTLPSSVNSVATAWKWIDTNIKGVPDVQDGNDHWQSPKTTMSRLAGDCEDFAILFASMCQRLGYTATIVCINHPTMGYHMVVLLQGKYYEPQTYGKYYTNPIVDDTWTLQEALYKCE